MCNSPTFFRYGDPVYGLLFFFMEISEYEGYENTLGAKKCHN